ncbi:MAG: hypothetical protein HRT61_21970, partial [Ekhidna sp.]|nr:hypothetical protein [Ekhidna sp.]
MRNLLLFSFIFLLSGLLEAQANDPADGYAIVRSDTIFGKVSIDFDHGSVMIYQDGVNRHFAADVELVTLLNDRREVFLPILEQGKTTFYRMLVNGERPLLELNGQLFSTLNDKTLPITDEKSVFQLFDKKKVKNYVFVRNLNLVDREA